MIHFSVTVYGAMTAFEMDRTTNCQIKFIFSEKWLARYYNISYYFGKTSKSLSNIVNQFLI